ncbi:MAG: calcium-binding EGF-like domain-containing protein [Flavobacteriales bacterium]
MNFKPKTKSIMKKLLYLVLVLGLATYFESCKEDDPCENVMCMNGGTCVDGTCSCLDGFDGTTCEIEDLCITHEVSCENDGTCEDGSCKCKTNYKGETCADKCVNGKYSDGDCTCDQGYEGSSCEYMSRRRFCGVYFLNSALAATGSNLTSTIDSAKFEDEVWKVSITNLTSKGDTKGYAEIDGNKISVPKQTLTIKEAGVDVKYSVFSTASAQWSAQGFTINISRTNLSVQGATAQTGDYEYTHN